MKLQDALRETGIAQVSYDGYTATVRDGEGEFGDMFCLSIQQAGMPPFHQEDYTSLELLESEMRSPHLPQPINWEPVEPEQ